MRFVIWMLLLAAGVQAEESSTESRPMYWPVVQQESVRLFVRTTSKRTTVHLAHLFSCYLPCEIDASRQEAAEIGKVLSKTEEFEKRLQGTRDRSEMVSIRKDLTIRFQTDASGTFGIAFLDDHGIDRVGLDGTTARNLAPHLETMVETVRFLDSIAAAPERAVEMSKVLSKTGKFSKKLDGTRDRNETVPIGTQFTVRFRTDAQGTFRVQLLDQQGVSRFSLDREDAEQMAPQLKKRFQ